MSLNSQIADLIVEKGRAQAQGAAGAGQAWGSALSQIGQTIAAVPQQIELGKQRADEQRARDARTALSDAMKAENVPDIVQGGVKLKDVGGIGRYMSAKGFGAEFAPAAQHLDAVNQSMQQFQAARENVIKTGAAGLLAADAPLPLINDFLNHLGDNQVYAPDTVKSYQEHFRDHPEDAKKILQSIVGQQKLEKVGPDESLVNPLDPTKPVFTGPPKPGEGQHVINGQVVGPDAKPIGSAIPEQVKPLAPEEIALKSKQIEEIDAKLKGTVPMSDKDKAELKLQRDRLNAEVQHWKDTDDAAPMLTPEAKRIAAQQWAMTGQMVPAGMGKAGTKMRADIMNSAAEIYKGLDLPSQMAAYKANQASLVRTQGTLDNLTAFEKAAGKNLDTFIALTKNFPDSGMPWANTPIRLLSDKMVGDKYLPAIQAARQIATREVARVVNDPGLKGELTDAARKGVDAMMSGDITLAQLKEVAPVLKNDMANVHGSISEQLRDIAERISTPPGETPKSAQPAKQPDTLLPGFKVQR